MAKVRFTRRAEADLDDIVAYTVQNWGDVQAARYLGFLERYCERLAEIPVLGRACDHIRTGLLRAERGSHVIFFRRRPDELVICRVMHKRMFPDAQPIDDHEG